MNRDEKAKLITHWQEQFQGSQAVILTDFCGLNVAEITDLRRKLDAVQAEYEVVKNTLFQIALKNAGQEGLDAHFVGTVGVIFSKGDPVAAAQVLNAFVQANEKLKLRVGVLQGKVVESAKVKELANLPPREVLVARLLGQMQAPIVSLLLQLKAVSNKLVLTLEAIRQKKS